MRPSPPSEMHEILNQKILEPHYGLRGDIAALDGELDQNYKVTCADGRRFVLKIMRAGCDIGLVDMQVQGMDFVSRQLTAIAVPAVVPTRAGKKSVILDLDGGGQRLCWVIEFLDGQLLDNVRDQPLSLMCIFGEQLGELVNVLTSFEHKALIRPLKWSLNQASWVADSLAEISDATQRSWVAQIMRRYEARTLSVLKQLPAQNIHSDAHGQNVLMADQGSGAQVSGLIDFGDMHRSNAICEVAIAAAYAMMNRPDPIACAESMVRGFHTTHPLSEDAVDIYLDLILTRLAVSAANSAIQKKLHPDDPYVVVSERPAWKLISRLMTMDHDWLRRRFRWACFGANRASQKLAVSSILRAEMRCQILPLDVQSTSAEYPLSAIDWALRYESDPQGVFFATPFLEPRATLVTGNPNDVPSLQSGSDLYALQPMEVLAPFGGTIISVTSGDEPVLIVQSSDPQPAYLHIKFHSGADLQHLTAGQAFECGATLAIAEIRGRAAHIRLTYSAFDPSELSSSLSALTVGDLGAAQDLFLNPAPLIGLEPAALRAEQADMQRVWERRKRNTASNQSLSYATPIEVVRGFQHYLFDAAGQRYIDAYNNVPHVGHCHPKVVAAAHHQMQLINTNTRYLNDRLAEYGEALKAKLPPALEICYFVNSASEGNELALRLARAATGAKDVIVMEHSYHGHTTSLVDISPYKHNGKGGQGAPDWVHTTTQADPYRGEFRYDDPDAGEKYARDVSRAIDDVHAKGRKLSAHICEMFPSVGGQMEYPKGYLKAVYEHVRAAGGICIADEVQTGLGRLGTHFWGFETQDVVPDIVVLGKPLGNGHPIGAVITTRAIAESFANGMEFFSTFGGNTVSCATGKAVLDVLEEERLQDNALNIGNSLLAGLRALQDRFDLIGDVRGRGLFIGVELVSDRETLEPAEAEAARIVNGLRDRHILIGRDGPMDNILKIRPPMTFDWAAADALLSGLEELL